MLILPRRKRLIIPRRDRCPNCGRERPQTRNMGRMFGAAGMMLGSSGIRMAAAANTCPACCDPLYQARNCGSNTLASLYVHKSQFPAWPSTYYFKYSGLCYYVQTADAVSSGTPVVSGQTDTGGGCGCFTCTKCGTNFCGDGTAPGQFLVTLSGLSVPTTCTAPTGTALQCSIRFDFAWLSGDTASGTYTVPFVSTNTVGGVINCFYESISNINTATYYAGPIGTCTGSSGFLDRLRIRISVVQNQPSASYYTQSICKVDAYNNANGNAGVIYEAAFSATCTGPVTTTNIFSSYAGCNHPMDMFQVGAGDLIIASGGSLVITGQAATC